MVSPNRIVALLTPVVAPAAALGATWLAEKLPGVGQGELEAIFVAAMLGVLVPAAQWLRGWQKYEEREAEHEHAVELAGAGSAPAEDYGVDDGYDVNDGYDADDGFDDYDDMGDDLDELDDELFADEPFVGAGS